MLGQMNRFAPSAGRPKTWLALECGAVFLGVPAAIAARWAPVPVIPVLLGMTAGCWLTLEWQHNIRVWSLLRPQVSGHEWRRMLVLYLIVLPGLVGLLWWMHPSLIFALLCHQPGFWLLILLAYPILSVLPQELIFRAFFFERYRPLFGRGPGMALASALVFAFGHVVFHNPVAVVLTFVGGWRFATTYQRTSSLICVSTEHALYGCTLFTIGYGPFFVDRVWWVGG
jgi:membrane protease YdiL (CAAX protease family)